MTMKPKTIEDRVASLEREVAALKAAVRSLPDAGAGPGFAEEGQPSLAAEAHDDKPGKQSLEQRVARLEAEIAELKLARPADNRADVAAWRATMGRFKDDPGYDEAMRLGAEWRRRENLKSIRELERRGEIDADPGHRPYERLGSQRKGSKKAARST
jgi:hypothetical protein